MKWANVEFEAVADIGIDFLPGIYLTDVPSWTKVATSLTLIQQP